MKRIVVGVDGSRGSIDALRWAVDHADEDTLVQAVLVWSYWPAPRGTHDMPTRHAVAAAAGRTLDEAVDAVQAACPDVKILREVVAGVPAATLTRMAIGADMLVVGARGLGGFRGLLVGSVSQQCVTHAPCPVVVVRSTN